MVRPAAAAKLAKKYPQTAGETILGEEKERIRLKKDKIRLKISKNSTSQTSMDEYPEITQSDRAVFRQGLQIVEEKQRITIMLDTVVINYFKNKAGKRGYQTLINETLKQIILSSESARQKGFEETLRKVIREELACLG